MTKPMTPRLFEARALPVNVSPSLSSWSGLAARVSSIRGTYDFILGLRSYFAFGTEGEIGIGSGVGTAQGGLDALLFTIRKCQVAKVEAEGASATEAAGGFTSSHDTCKGGTLGDGNGAIRIVDRFVNSGLNGLSGRRDSRVQFFVEVRLNDPGRRGIADRGCDGREAWIWRVSNLLPLIGGMHVLHCLALTTNLPAASRSPSHHPSSMTTYS